MPRSAGEKSPAKMLSRSVPTSPKNQHDLTKSSTLPPPRVTGAQRGSAPTSGCSSGATTGASTSSSGSVGASPRKSRSNTLSSFLKKLSPKLRQGTTKSRDKTWYVVEIAQRDVDGQDRSEPTVKTREPVLPTNATTTTELHEPLVTAAEPSSGNSSTKSTPSKSSTRAAAKALGDEKQFLSKIAPKKLLQETISKQQQSAQQSPRLMTKSSTSTKDQAKDKVQPVHAPFASQPLIRINSSAAPSQNENSQPGTLIRRLHQPPRTLNILNKIVVRPPEVEKVKGKMTSVESIGSCSLDVDATASESSGTADGRASSISQHTLCSASGGSSVLGPVVDISHSPRSPLRITTTAEITGAVPTTSVPEIRYVSELYIPNGRIHSAPEGYDELNDQRKPSYINISCSVSGYTSYSCYNSKVREELRSRDNSPARLAFSNENGHSRGQTDHLHSLDIELNVDSEVKTPTSKKPTPTKLHSSSIVLNVNGSDVVDRASRLSLYEDKRSSVWWASSEDGILSHQGHTVFTKRQEVCESHKDSNGSNSVQRTCHESSEIIDKNNNDDERYQNSGASLRETKSLIQQRIERLYGPGALAQGFRIHRERKHSATYGAAASQGQTPQNPNSKDGPPVFRHLNHHIYDEISYSPSPSKVALPFYHPSKQQMKPNGSPGIDAFTKLPNKVHGMINNETGEKYRSGRTNSDLARKDERTNLIPSVQRTTEPLVENEDILSSGVKNVKWFIDAMNNEKEKIKSLIAKAEQILNGETLSEDNCGRIRAAIGKANLLLTQKFLQFKGLCEKNLTQSVDEPFPTTLEDLAGFWDMVLIQVDDIYGMFDAIEKAQQRGWCFDEVDLISVIKNKKLTTVSDGTSLALHLPTGTSKGKKPALRKAASSIPPQRSTKSQEAAKAREEARRRLLEAKRKGRHQTAFQTDNPGIEIYMPEDKL